MNISNWSNARLASLLVSFIAQGQDTANYQQAAQSIVELLKLLLLASHRIILDVRSISDHCFIDDQEEFNSFPTP